MSILSSDQLFLHSGHPVLGAGLQIAQVVAVVSRCALARAASGIGARVRGSNLGGLPGSPQQAVPTLD